MKKGPIKEILKKVFYRLVISALNSSKKRSGRLEKITSIDPDISDQFSTWTVGGESIYDVSKIRNIHAF